MIQSNSGRTDPCSSSRPPRASAPIVLAPDRLTRSASTRSASTRSASTRSASTRVVPALVTASLLALGSAGIAKAEVGLGGHLKSFVFMGVQDPYSIDRAGSRLQLAVQGSSGDMISYYAATDFELDNRLLNSDQPASRGEGFDVYPVEAYLNLSRGPLELRIGQQFIFWGKTTWVNPTDVITAWNYPDMASEIEDYRTAPFAARANLYGPWDFMADLVWVPLFRPNRLGDTIPEEMGGMAVVEGPSLLPEPTLQNGEFGFRLNHTISNLALDWSISGYKGFEKMPGMMLSPHFPEAEAETPSDDPAGHPTSKRGIGHPGARGNAKEGDVPIMPDYLVMTRRYDPLWMLGFDVSKAAGPLVLKAEGAYKRTDDTAGDDPLIRNSRLEGVAGVDVVLSQDFDFGVQYIATQLLNYDIDAEEAALIAMYGSAPPFTSAAFSQQVSLRTSFKLTSNLGCQLTGLYNLTYRDFFLLGFVYWEIADALKAYLGGVGFGGKEATTPYGAQTQNSRAFVEVKYSF